MTGSPVLIILGSARGDGNTRRAVDHLRDRLGGETTLVDLSDCAIAPFRYDATDTSDDFLTIIDQMLAHEQIVFATPVYWYAMSGLMKNFFDRITGLLIDDSRRRVARSLAGRNVWLLATGSGEALPAGFHEPFAGTATYLGMHWQDATYIRSIEGTAFEPADELARRLRA